MKTCRSQSTVTKWEIYHGFKPDLRTIRRLRIFSVLYVLCSSKTNNPVSTNKRYWKRGLYVGPSIIVPGSIRAAINTNKRIKIVTTSNFKRVSDGGALQIYNQIDRINTQDSADIPDVDRDQDTNATPVESADPLIPSTSDVEPSSYNHPDEAEVAAILQHTGKAKKKTKKKTKMKFKVHWQGYDDTHDSWLTWLELRHNTVLHAYLTMHNLGHLIPRDYQPHASLNTDSKADDSSHVTCPSTESRVDEGDVSSNEHHAIPIHAAQRDQVSMQKQVNAWLSREERMKAREKSKQ